MVIKITTTLIHLARFTCIEMYWGARQYEKKARIVLQCESLLCAQEAPANGRPSRSDVSGPTSEPRTERVEQCRNLRNSVFCGIYTVQMKRSTKAVLFSGLIFPGLGHMVLKQYVRGSILMLAALIALAVIVKVATEQALAVIDSMASGEIPVDTGAMTELVSNSVSSADSSMVNYSLLVILVCWLIGMVDSYRLGNIQDKQNSPG